MEKQKIIVQELSGSEPSAESTSTLPDTPTLFKDPPNAEEWNNLRAFIHERMHLPQVTLGEAVQDWTHTQALRALKVTCREEDGKQSRLIMRIQKGHSSALKAVGLRMSSFLQAVGHMVIAVRESQNHSEKRRLAQGCYQLVAETAEQLFAGATSSGAWTKDDFCRGLLMPETTHDLRAEVETLRSSLFKQQTREEESSQNLEKLGNWLKQRDYQLPTELAALIEGNIPEDTIPF